MFVDAHCHFIDVPTPFQALENARQNNVQWIVSNGVDLAANRKTLEYRTRFSNLFACIGLHPKECLKQTQAKNQQTLAWMQQRFEAHDPAGIGEIGLDFLMADSLQKRERQQQWFEEQLKMARAFDKPATIHARNAIEKTLNTLEKLEMQKALLHWFDGTPCQLEKTCKQGFFVSIGPAVLFQKKIQKIAQNIPLQNLLLETDAPVPFNGKPSQPAWIASVAQKIATIQKISLETIAQQTTQNAEKFFGFKNNF